MEQFVQLIVAGGLALVAGLWATAGFAPWTAPWVAGAAVAVLGSGALAAGIRSELSVW